MQHNASKNYNSKHLITHLKGWSCIVLSLFFVMACTVQNPNDNKMSEKLSILPAPETLNQAVNDWHEAAANADSATYFDFITEKGRFLGTDANENWSKAQFLEFSTPYFQKGKAWSFKPYDRNVYYSSDSTVAWFDERLETWMGECRGSGVLMLENNALKLAHYNLTVTIANEKIQDFIQLVEAKN